MNKDNKKELSIVFASTESTPRMIKFAQCMGDLVKFHLFFTSRPIGRPFFWSKYKINKFCSIEKKTIIIFGKTWNTNIYRKTVSINPDILLLGGFFEITHFFLYIWAFKNKKKVIVISEPFWNPAIGKKRKVWQTKIIARFFIKIIYNKIDAILAIGDETKLFFEKYVGIKPSIVYSVTYPVDINNYLKHPLRNNKKGLTFLFPHRLIEIYNPLMCLYWFLEIEKTFQNVNLIFNGHGALRKNIENIISKTAISSKITFTDGITSWDDMANIYKNADIMLSTKSVSHSSEWSVAEIEALASGMGVIAFNNSRGLVNAITLNNSGFIINKINDFNAVKRAVSEYMNSEKKLINDGKLNREIAKQFSTENMSLKYLEISKIINGKK